MTKKMKSILGLGVLFAGMLVLAMVLPSCGSTSSSTVSRQNTQQQTDSNFEVKEGNFGYWYVNGYNGTNKDVVISERIRGYHIRGIGDNALEKKELTSVTLNNNVEYVGKRAFADNQITKVTILNNETAGSRIILPDFDYIGEEAFAGNPIAQITINALVDIEKNAFDNGFVDFYIANSAQGGTYTLIDGSWNLQPIRYFNEIDFDIETLADGRSVRITGFEGNYLAIPPHINGLLVKEIGDNAFRNKGVRGVIIPKGVSTIGDFAFAENMLTDVSIRGDGVKVGRGAFNAVTLELIYLGRDAQLYIDDADGFHSFDRAFIYLYNGGTRYAGWYLYLSNQAGWSLQGRRERIKRSVY